MTNNQNTEIKTTMSSFSFFLPKRLAEQGPFSTPVRVPTHVKRSATISGAHCMRGLMLYNVGTTVIEGTIDELS